MHQSYIHHRPISDNLQVHFSPNLRHQTISIKFLSLFILQDILELLFTIHKWFLPFFKALIIFLIQLVFLFFNHNIIWKTHNFTYTLKRLLDVSQKHRQYHILSLSNLEFRTNLIFVLYMLEYQILSSHFLFYNIFDFISKILLISQNVILNRIYVPSST